MKLQRQFAEVARFIEQARAKAIKNVNAELINLYWKIGEYISNKVQNAEWGEGTVGQLAQYINDKYPDLKRFTCRGLYRMKQFFETYQGNEIVSPLVTQISWTNNLLILSKTKSIEEKEFYLKLEHSCAN